MLAGDLPAYTPATITDPEVIRERLAEIRDEERLADGGVRDRGQLGRGSGLRRDGTVIAAIHTHGPSYRFPGERSPIVLAGHVRAVADRLTDRLRA